MGARDTSQLSPEDELGQLISGAKGRDQASPDEELRALIESAGPPRAQGHVTEMPVQNIEGDPHAGAGFWRRAYDRLSPSPERRAAQNDEAARQFVGGMEAASTPAGAARAVFSHLAAPFAAAGPVGMAVASGAEQYAADPDRPWRAALAAVTSGLAGKGGNMIARGLGGAATSAGEAADVARLRAPGMPANEVTAMSPEARAALAAKLEDPANGLTTSTFQSPAGYLKNAQGLADRGLQRMQGAEGQIAALPEQPSVPVGDIIDAQRAKAQELSSLADFRGNRPQISYRNDVANRLEADAAEAGPNGELPWQRALEQRRNLDANTRFGANPGAPTSINAARGEVGNDLRRGIDSALDSPNVPPELASNWRGGRDQYALGSQVGETAYKAIPNSALPESFGAIPAHLMRQGGQSALATGARAVQGGLNNAAGATQAATPALALLAGKKLSELDLEKLRAFIQAQNGYAAESD